MTRPSTLLLALAVLIAAPQVHAALKAGAKAPAFATQATIGGKVFDFSLVDALKKGPVVLYFYPEAFTPGCTIEAHEFAAAADDYKAAGATVIGVSHDGIEKLKKFSVSECRSKFAVAADEDHHIMKAYDAVLPQDPSYSDRISYVIAPSGEILYVFTSMDRPKDHVTNTLEAVRKWAKDHPH